MQKIFFVLIIGFTLFISCKKKPDPVPEPVIVGLEGDTCRISKVSYGPFQKIIYEYTGDRVNKIILQIDGNEYPGVLEYDAEGKLTKVKGLHVDTQYEYDSKSRLIKENRTLHNEGVYTLISHWEARIFEYNNENQVAKCSYLEGRGTDYNSFYVKKGEVYRYETYLYDFQGCVEKLESYERTPRSTKFDRTAVYIYQYDKLINPFYGHPGIYDVKTYFGADSGNGVLTFSKHNVIKVTANGMSENIGYTHSSTKYPLSIQNVRWQENHFPDLNLEYVNCK
ncbi:hypothetical protein [Dyadobacter pollutisoli]|uniref:DUF4595 domain-containing protein n=1 Tax=Dyadobacter pollutisoli TaxID=2910158 RepID=A0A9E8SM79_9BACT|nr:hypothetical protein [Dyadobacter pollutisoli]WAC12496.1 hypothetical protein ON006_00750 [Dyadobacter pollutisoli]